MNEKFENTQAHTTASQACRKGGVGGKLPWAPSRFGAPHHGQKYEVR